MATSDRLFSLVEEVWKLTGENLSTVDVGMLDYATQLHFKQKQPNLKLKTRLKQLLGYPHWLLRSPA